MYWKEFMHQKNSHNTFPPHKKSINNLGIFKVDRKFNVNTNQLILLVQTSKNLDKEVDAFLEGNKLVLGSSLQMEFNQPYRAHLVDKDLYNDELDVSIIGFSEIDLKPQYHYTLDSCQLINPNLVKIILTSKKFFITSNHLHLRNHGRRKYAV